MGRGADEEPERHGLDRTGASAQKQFFLNRALYLLKNLSFFALLILEIMGIMDHHHGSDLRGGYTSGKSGFARGGFVLIPPTNPL